jgi:hypothetical protein
MECPHQIQLINVIEWLKIEGLAVVQCCMKTGEIWTIVRISSPKFGYKLCALDEVFFFFFKLILAHTAGLPWLLTALLNKSIKH